MKQQIHFRLLILLLIIPTLVIANPLKTTKEKTIQKSFEVVSDATLKINNKYGNIDIITWDKNTIEFDVVIKVTGSNSGKIDNRLNEIDVKFSASKEWVAAETIFGKKKKTWWNWGSNNKLKAEINYIIKMPVTNNVILNNDYGSINLDKIEGVAKINCDYGKITTKELMADNNVINFDYSKGCYFEYVKSAKINVNYSGFTISKSENIELNADYTKSVIKAIENMSYNCDYGSLTIDNINNIEGNSDYLKLGLGNVFKKVDLKADYGSIKIGRMASNSENISIESDYTGITIGLDKDYSFKFDINLQNASISNINGFNIVKKRIKSSNKYYAGSYGNPNTKNMVQIKAEYGSVTFKKQ